LRVVFAALWCGGQRSQLLRRIQHGESTRHTARHADAHCGACAVYLLDVTLMQCDCEHLNHEAQHVLGACPNTPIYKVWTYGMAQNLCGVCVLFLVNNHSPIEQYRQLSEQEVAQ
jgi:hypothetical protein